MNCSENIVHRAKAVANGAVSFYLDHYVTARVAKVSYGFQGSTSYFPDDPEHARRSQNVWARPSGREMISGGFITVLERVR